MNAQIIPLQVDHCPDPTSFDARFRPREFTERHLKSELLRYVEKHIEIVEFKGPYGEPGIRARIFLADGWGDIEEMRSDVLRQAQYALSAAMDSNFRWESERMEKRNALDEERAKFTAEMERAQADFRARFQASIQEFWGYDECAGRA